MQLLKYGKDGGVKSKVWGFWLCEFKSLFSIALLVFEDGSREAYHSHAFNCWNIVLKGHLEEHSLTGRIRHFKASLRPFGVYRDDFHKVYSKKRTYVLTVRGPWTKTWQEYLPETDEFITLANKRTIIARVRGCEVKWDRKNLK